MENEPGLAGIFATADDLSGLVRFTQPCIEQYRDHIDPRMSLATAQAHLYRRMLTDGRFHKDPPQRADHRHRAIGFVVIDNHITLYLRTEHRDSHPFVAFAIQVPELS